MPMLNKGVAHCAMQYGFMALLLYLGALEGAGQLVGEGGGQEQHGEGGGQHGAGSHAPPHVAVVVHVGVHWWGGVRDTASVPEASKNDKN